MLTEIKRHSKTVLRRVPFVQSYLKERDRRKRFSATLELINGTHRNTNTHPSIIHFSVNKAATQYTKTILRRCAAENGMVPLQLHEYAASTDFPYLDYLSATAMQKYNHIFKPHGYLYSVFGGMIEGIPELERYRLILMMRDPRDVLVSEYYSIAYSHKVPDPRGDKYEHFMNRRKTAQSMTIDEFVLWDSDRIYSTLQRYKTLLIDSYPHTYVTTYEKMTADFQDWLNGLLDNCQLAIPDHLRRSLMEESDRLRPKEENIHKHRRKGKAQDYKEKLKTETIDQLNAKFAFFLEAFGYRS
jgi:Sulfotransferase domain